MSKETMVDFLSILTEKDIIFLSGLDSIGFEGKTVQKLNILYIFHNYSLSEAEKMLIELNVDPGGTSLLRGTYNASVIGGVSLQEINADYQSKMDEQMLYLLNYSLAELGGAVKDKYIQMKPEGAGNGRVITIPVSVSGKVNGVNKTLYPQNNWSSFEGQEPGTAKDSNGRYKIAVGPKILDENYSDIGKIWAEDFSPSTRIDIVLENKITGELKTLECIATHSKAHTYNKYPDNHPKSTLTGDAASFDIENGLLQTGISYPNSWNATYDRPFAPNNIDSSSIEFVGNSVGFTRTDYKLIKIIVLE